MKIADNVRITHDRELSHTMVSVLQGVNDNPGTGFKELYTVLKMNSNTVASALYRLSTQHRIAKVKLDGYMRYYPSNYKLSEAIKPTALRTFFRCDECNKEFEVKQGLAMHKTRMHTEIGLAQNGRKPYKSDKLPEPEQEGTRTEKLLEKILHEPRYTKDDIIRLAKDYVWQKNDYSLKNFIDWLLRDQNGKG